LFGREAVEHQIRRVQQYLHDVGYGPTSADHPCFVTALATLMLRIGSCDWTQLPSMRLKLRTARHHLNPNDDPRTSALPERCIGSASCRGGSPRMNIPATP
jgi:hypothetical protein